MPQHSAIPDADSDAALPGDKKKRKKLGKHEYSLPVGEPVESFTTEDKLKLAGGMLLNVLHTWFIQKV